MSAAKPHLNELATYDDFSESISSLRREITAAVDHAAPDKELLELSYRNSDMSGKWDLVLRSDPTLLGRLIDHAFITYGAIPYPVLNPTVPAGVLQSFVELVGGQKGVGFLDKLASGYYAVPLFQIGPAFVLGHFDPSFPFRSLLPSDLAIPVWLTMGDYEALRSNMVGQLQAAGDHGLQTRPFARLETFEEFLSSRSKTIDIENPVSSLREFLEWTLTLGNIGASDQQSVSALLCRDDLSNVGLLSPDMQLLAYKVLFGYSVLKTENLRIPPEPRERLDVLDDDFLQDNQLCPIAVTDTQCLALVDQPVSAKLDDDFHNRVNLTGIGIIVPAQQLQTATSSKSNLEVIYAGTQDTDVSAETPAYEMEQNEFKWSQTLPREISSDPDRLVSYILFFTAISRAADLHFDYMNGVYRVRWKIDGMVRTMMELPGDRHDSLAARLKTKSGIALEQRSAADGRFLFTIGRRRIDTRVKMVLDSNGKFRFVLRLLDKSTPIKTVASLGLMAHEITALSDVYNSHDGLLFVCGATSQGKSTTLFAITNDINKDGNVIYSLEDPPEYVIAGVTQIPCTSEQGKEKPELPYFSTAIKSLLRMAPSAISVGEIRDRETLASFIDIGLSGHFGMCTFHAKDVFAGIKRLLSFDVNPVDLADTARMFVSQRLVRKVCACHRLEPLTKEQLSYFGEAEVNVPNGHAKVPVEVGCPQCRGTGFLGQMAVMEMLPVSEKIGSLIVAIAASKHNPPLEELRRVAKDEGYRSIFQNALSKVLLGQTTLAEVDRQIKRVARVQRLDIHRRERIAAAA